MPGETQGELIQRLMAQARRVLRGQENRAADKVIEIYRAAQDDITTEIINILRRAGMDTLDLAQMKLFDRDRALFAAINQHLTRLSPAVSAAIEDAFVEQWAEASLRAAYAIDQAIPEMNRSRIPILPDRAIRALANMEFKGAMFSQRIGVITDIMAADIQKSLLNAMIRGESMADAASAVSEIIGAGNLADPSSFAARAEMIARTEIMRASNMGYQAAYAENDDVLDGWTWLTTPDDRLCDECLELDGKTDEELDGLEPPLHPNCRCVALPRLKSWKDMGMEGMPDTWKDDERGMRDPISGEWQVQPIEKFNDWKAERLGVAV